MRMKNLCPLDAEKRARNSIFRSLRHDPFSDMMRRLCFKDITLCRYENLFLIQIDDIVKFKIPKVEI